MKTQQGFTLIELMIVVAIIGILAAIAIPAYQNYVAKSQMTEAISLADGLKTDVASYWTQNGTCPTSGSDGIPAAANVTGKYVQSVQVYSTCKITATMKTSGIASGISGTTLTLQAGYDTSSTSGTTGTSTSSSFTALPTSSSSSTASIGSIAWQCKSTAAQKYLPSSCTGT